MSYDTVEAGAETLLKTVDGFSAAVSRGDYRILAAGNMKAVVMNPGRFGPRSMASNQRVRNVWVINLELYISWSGEISDVKTAIRDERQAILDMIDKYPTLNSVPGVVFAMIESGDEPDLYGIAGSSRQFWRQTMFLRVEERANITYAE